MAKQTTTTTPKAAGAPKEETVNTTKDTTSKTIPIAGNDGVTTSRSRSTPEDQTGDENETVKDDDPAATQRTVDQLEGGGRNNHYEGNFEGESDEQRDARLAQARLDDGNHAQVVRSAASTDPTMSSGVTEAVTGAGEANPNAAVNTKALSPIDPPLGVNADDANIDGEDDEDEDDEPAAPRDDFDYTVPADNVARNDQQLAALVQKHGRENRHFIINEDTSGVDAQCVSKDKFALLFDIDYGNGSDRTLRITNALLAAGIEQNQIEYYNSSLAAFKKFGNADARYKSGVTQAQLSPTQDRAEAEARGEATGDGVADGF
jgi:hypothetical protein